MCVVSRCVESHHVADSIYMRVTCLVNRAKRHVATAAIASV